MPFVLMSSAFEEGEEIPARFTCDEENRSPALHWSGQPEGAQSFALTLHDPDAPKPNFTHWVLFDIPPGTTDLPEGMPEGQVGVAGTNDFDVTGYRGPCPPQEHDAHRYVFTLYALDVQSVDLGPPATRADLEAKIHGRVLGQATLTGRYKRQAIRREAA